MVVFMFSDYYRHSVKVSDLDWGVSYNHKASPDPIICLETSVCADGSQQLNETKIINNFYTKSLGIFFFGGYFYIFVAFGSFFMSQNHVFGFS